MTGHTKEPWEVFVPCEVTADDPTGQFSHSLICETYNSPNPRKDANRIVSCVNALATIPDPSAYIAAARGMREALERVQKTMDGYRSQAKFCDIEALGYFREFDRRIETSQFRTALRTFDAAQGEQ